MVKVLRKKWIKDLIIVGIGVFVIWIGLQIVFGTQNPFYVVSSGSMVPELEEFDVLVVQGNDPFDSVKVGDIIVFNRPSGTDRVIVHRVAGIIDDDPLTLRTKGDANPASIPGTDFPITEEEYIGKVYTVIPQIGYVTRILTPPINYIIIGIIIVVWFVQHQLKKTKEKELSHSFEFDSTDKNDPKEPPSTFENLDDLPKDTEYTEINKDVRDAALREEGINFDPEKEKSEENNTNSDSNEKKFDEN